MAHVKIKRETGSMKAYSNGFFKGFPSKERGSMRIDTFFQGPSERDELIYHGKSLNPSDSNEGDSAGLDGWFKYFLFGMSASPPNSKYMEAIAFFFLQYMF